MLRFPSLSQRSSWASTWTTSLLLFGSLFTSIQAASPGVYITGTDAKGVTRQLLDSRFPALYTGDFGDCMGGQSLINVTAFDAAYYADNMTVLFHIAGMTNLASETVMLNIEVDAYGENRYDLTFNPCGTNMQGLCPMNASIPILAEAIIPVSQADVSGIPNIALVIPDFEGSATLRIFSNSTQTQIACFQAVMRNGASFSHPGPVGGVLGGFTALTALASFATAIYGVSLPHIRIHHGHSLPVLVVFEVFHSIFFTGALSVNWPSVCAAFWSNFAWSAGMIPVSSIVNTADDFVGVTGNSSQVGGAGSSVINNNGGLLQQIYGRSISLTQVIDRDSDSWRRGHEMLKRLSKRAASSNNQTKQYDWNGGPVAKGLPIPGNWTHFGGELSEVGIPVADAFLVGLLWFLILLAIIIGLVVLFKLSLEGLDAMKMIKNDGLAFFRSHWLGFIGVIVLRSMMIGFFAIMTLALYQLSLGGNSGITAVAVVIFLIFLLTVLGVSFYACYSRLRLGRYQSSPDRIHFQGKKVMKFLPWVGTVRESQLAEKDKSKSFAGSVSFFRIDHVNHDSNTQNVHEDMGFLKRFGWLTSHYRKSRWWYFAPWVIYQVIRACFIGGARGNPNTQVYGNLVVEILAMIMIFAIRPFEGNRNMALAVYMLSISKVLTAGLCIAFLPQFNVARIPTTVIGVVIIVIQGLLVVAMIILMVLGFISSYLSVSRNRPVVKPKFMEPLRVKYLEHAERKATDQPREREPEAQEPEGPKEPYFSVNTIHRAPKIEDEDEDNRIEPVPVPLPEDPTQNRQSRISMAPSARSSHSNFGNVPFGARVYRASWTSRDFNLHQQDFERMDGSATPSKRYSHVANRSISNPIPGTTTSRNILTSRKYGVSTVWLVATLGAKSNSKRLNRKAILEVDVRKACQTIIEPHAPLALRLQSNLLYGVSRVYSQQCGYVLADAQVAQNHIRNLLNSTRDDKLIQDAGANRNQLILQDDPAFALDQALPALNLGFLAFDIPGNDTQHSILSISPHTQLNSTPSPHGSALRLNIPSSSIIGGAVGTNTYQLPIHDAYKRDSNISCPRKNVVDGLFEDEEQILFDDSTFEFDAEGNFHEILAPERDFRQGTFTGDDVLLPRREQQEKITNFHSPGDQVDINVPVDYDEIELLPDAEPFMTGALQALDGPYDPSFVRDSSESAEAPAKRRRPRKIPKCPALDKECQVTKRMLMEWQEGYDENMTKAKEVKSNNQRRAHAKRNAFEFVFGNGINGVGRGYGSEKFDSPLNMFSGEKLMENILGRSLNATGKHARDGEDDEEPEDGEARRVRKRQDRDEEQVGRGTGYDDDEVMMSMGMDDTEVGRGEASALQDYASSTMPWNVSASVNSHTRGHSSSIAGRGVASSQPGSQHGNRLPSASPLIGRGTALSADLITYGRDEEEDRAVLAEDDDAILRRDIIYNPFPLLSSDLSGGSKRDTSAPGGLMKDFDVFSPAAAVDTQTAASSQWIKLALDREAGNFLDYVWNSIQEKAQAALHDDDNDLYGAGADTGVSGGHKYKRSPKSCISFEELFTPEDHSHVVAAQAFYHVLTLATKNVVWVEQDAPKGDGMEPLPFGEIKIGVLSPPASSPPASSSPGSIS
ncbi:hypothetical protein F5884DRAFT_669269 [Xylogone sp. PMI_703]|nr:hypothetical protein F5884DRAFT_669269 [Xylogone sp. PMI_703]